MRVQRHRPSCSRRPLSARHSSSHLTRRLGRRRTPPSAAPRRELAVAVGGGDVVANANRDRARSVVLAGSDCDGQGRGGAGALILLPPAAIQRERLVEVLELRRISELGQLPGVLLGREASVAGGPRFIVNGFNRVPSRATQRRPTLCMFVPNEPWRFFGRVYRSVAKPVSPLSGLQGYDRRVPMAEAMGYYLSAPLGRKPGGSESPRISEPRSALRAPRM